MRIKIIGTLGYTPWRSKLAKKFTSSRWFWNGKSLQIDIGNKYQGTPVDFLLITHIHYDHIQEFSSCPNKTEVLVPSGTFIDRLRERNEMVNFRLFKTKTDLAGLSVRPFPVLHSSTSLTYGFKFFWKKKVIVWLPDYCIIPTFSDVFSNVDILFLGAAAMRKPIMHKGHGHCQGAVYKTLGKIAELRNPPKKIFLIHFGMGMSPIVVKTKYLQRKFPSLDIDWTKDGKLVKVKA